MRLAVPVTDLYRSYVHRHPGHVAVDVDTHAPTRPLAPAATPLPHAEGAGEGESQRLFNYLDVTIARLSGLPDGVGGGPPLAYVHFLVCHA